MKKKNILSTFISLFLTFSSFAQTTDETIFKQKIMLPNAESKAQTALVLAKSLIGKPYKAGTLEGNKNEKLVCNLSTFDCSTFVESIVAMTITKFSDNRTFENYNLNLKSLRYRNGKINGYGSRLHYFREWMIQVEQNGIAKDVTNLVGGMKYKKSINFMTNNRDLYPALKDDLTFAEVKNAQKNINNNDFYFIPKEFLARHEQKIQDGDIIAITSSVDGLDFNHEGFAIRQNGKLHLLHASYEQKKVVVSSEPLTSYLNRISKHSGISVLRLL